MDKATHLLQENQCGLQIPRKYFLSPFPSLRLNNQLNHGGNAIILAFPGSIVFKGPIKWGYDDGFPNKARKGAEIQEFGASESIMVEKEMFSILQKRPHPNIIQAIMIVPEGIFLPRMWSALSDRVIAHRDLHYPRCYIDDQLKLRWISQIASAASWLEHLGYAHGDLTPRNIMLDWYDDIKICDFGESVRIGGESQCGTPPYVLWIFEIRDHRSEQYAIGWTIYTLYNDVPEQFETPEDIDDFTTAVFPETGDIPLGFIVQKCWRLKYQSISALDEEIRRTVASLTPWYHLLIGRLLLSLRHLIDQVRNWIIKQNCRRLYSKLAKQGIFPVISWLFCLFVKDNLEYSSDLDYRYALDEMPKPLSRDTKYDP